MSNKWNEQDIQFLRYNYPSMGANFCSKELSRSVPSVRQKARSLDLFSEVGGRGGRKWNHTELDLLIEKYGSIGAINCAKLLNRSYDSVKLKANSLGLKSINRWSLEEDNILIDNYPHVGAIGCLKLVNNRTREAIVTRAGFLGLKTLVQYNKKTMNTYETELFELEIDFFPIEDYIDCQTPIKHECLQGHVWKVKPSHILAQASGCPSCSTYGFDPNQPAMLYYISFQVDNKTYFKIGVSKHSVYYRFSKDRDKIINLLYWEFYYKGSDALNREKELLNKYSQYRIHVPNLLKSSGNTELFDKDILSGDLYEY